MKLLFVSSRRLRGTGEEREENRPRTVQISVPSELMMDLLTKGAILQFADWPCAFKARSSKACPQARKDQNQFILSSQFPTEGL